MLVTPLPGVDRKNLLDTLRAVQVDVGNLASGGPHGYYERLLAYLDWSNSAVQQLGSLISSADIDRLVLTKRHGQLLAGVGGLMGKETERLTNNLVSIEQRQRARDLEEAVKLLERQLKAWDRLGAFVVADSSFYIHHRDKFEEANYRKLLGVWEDPIHLLVPMVVVDELDRLKESKDQHTRWRAGYTLGVLDNRFQTTVESAVLRREDFSGIGTGELPQGEVTVEILADPPGHVRLPIPDDEIVDRAVAVKPLAGREVTLLTYDTGQAMRGRRAGLKVVKLDQERGEEPEAKKPTASKAKG